MFDTYLKDLIDKVPVIEDYDSDDFRSILSDAYLELIRFRTHYDYRANRDTDDIILSLRKLADTFEYFGILKEDITTDIKTASCYVAAEALDLLTNILSPTVSEKLDDVLNNYEITLLESGMLYLIAGYDANSKKIMQSLKDSINSRELSIEIKWAINQVISIIEGSNRSIETIEPTNSASLAFKNYFKIYSEIGIVANKYHAWLTGDGEELPTNLISKLEELINTLTYDYSSFYSTPIHIARLLKEFIKNSYARSVFHSVPKPQTEHNNYESFLKNITIGDNSFNGQLFLWPSAIGFVEKCLPGPETHSIIATPTGSGKSTIAKLAASQALTEGWVLYLAPTNALVHQIQRDLKKVKWPWKTVKVKSFIGYDEYTALTEDQLLPSETENHIYVMTPEKCALAMRLSPDFFKTCRLCIFDEFHEIGSNSRGVTIDVIFGTLLTLSPFVRLQLISAMIENSEDIKEWLKEVSNFDVNIIDLKWRPTRTMKGVVGLEQNEFRTAVKNAPLKPKARKRRASNTPYFGLFGLQGAWQSNDKKEYRFGYLGATYDFEFTEKTSPFESWVNKTMGLLAFHFGSNNMKTIGFFPKNKNYPFTVARNMQSVQIDRELWNDEISRLITIANAELGLPTKLVELIEKGVTVHTSLMTQTEKDLAELAFITGLAKIMLATSTLSQGLNLPAEVVLLGGTELGNEYNILDREALLSRKNTQFLNSIGRAGRAEYSSQGLALVIPSNPIIFKDENYNLRVAKREAWFLEYQDASQEIESPLSSFLNRLITESIDTELISEEELALLPFFTENSPIPITVLNKTLGAYNIQKKVTDTVSSITGPIIKKIHENFMKETGAPDWVFSSARKSGVTVFVVQEMLKTLKNAKIPSYQVSKSWDINSWSNYLIDILARMNPNLIKSLINSFNVFKNEAIPFFNENLDYTAWKPTKEWIQSWEEIRVNLNIYYGSKNIKEIGINTFPSIIVSNERTQGAFIPTVLKLLEYKGPFENLSRFASVLISILEEMWMDRVEQDEVVTVPFQLSMLPIAIKMGLKDVNSVAWYRFGYRNRFVAQALGSIIETNIASDSSEIEVIKIIRDKKMELLIKNPEEIGAKLTNIHYTENEISAFFLIVNET
ncbi:DEAD/DEAH box helicase [Psychrobacillus sp. NPDC093180]|uniref:DEAD/DEAH box helicase n=1 Tax=Psychrobacillus sp. NPDC093180 TaxID=3364489 RepID=UPI0038231505